MSKPSQIPEELTSLKHRLRLAQAASDFKLLKTAELVEAMPDSLNPPEFKYPSSGESDLLNPGSKCTS